MRTPFSNKDLWSVCLVAASFAYFWWGFWERWDFPLMDGAYYYELAEGWSHFPIRLDREWSPLYVASYAVFQKLLPGNDPFLAYSLHRIAVLFLIAALLWHICRRFFSVEMAATFSVLAVCNAAIAGSFHVVHAVGLLFVLIVLNFAVRKPQFNRLLIAGLTLCGVFVRPEFLLAFVLLAAFALLEWVKGSIGRHQLRFSPAVLACLVLALGLWLQSPPTSGNRLFDAFAQQTIWARDGQTQTEGAMGPTVQDIYGDADTIVEAALENPAAFGEHLGRNLFTLPRVLLETIKTLTPSLEFSMLLLVSALLAAALLSAGPHRNIGPFWPPAIAFAATGLAVSLLIRTTAWYLMVGIPLYFVLLAMAFSKLTARAHLAVWPRRAVLAAWIAILVATVVIARRNFPTGQPVVQFSRLLASQNPEIDPVRILAFSPQSYCIMIESLSTKACQRIGHERLSAEVGFAEFLREENVNAVSLDSYLRQTAQELNRLDVFQFERSPSEFGFQELSPSGDAGGARFFVRVF